jgi:hypothetical protein
MMDNFSFDVTAEGDTDFKDTLRLAIRLHGTTKITHYAILPNNSDLALFWMSPDSDVSGARPLPYPMDVEAVIVFVVGWLRTADYDDQPDHDGDNGKGWRVYNESWGQVWGARSGVIAVQTAWTSGSRKRTSRDLRIPAEMQ